MPPPELLLPWLLAAQGAMGGVDTLLNHEILQRLPKQPFARREIGLHAIREALYGTVFLLAANCAMRGAALAWVVGLLTVELFVTVTDEYVENRTRVLPQNERVLHVFLTLNLGLILGAGALGLANDGGIGFAPADLGWLGWVLAALGLAAYAWCVRDAIAWMKLRRVAPA